MSPRYPLIIQPSDLPPLPSSENIILLDATYHLDPSRDPRTEYEQRHLPGARFWSLKDVSEPHPLGFKLMLPSSERFVRYVTELGITKDTHVIVYDTQGIWSAPRTVFTFLAYGHENVSLLVGGLPAAIDAGIAMESGRPKTVESPTPYPPVTLRPNYIASFDDIQSISANDATVSEQRIVDARGARYFVEGRIPTSKSLPWGVLLDTVRRQNTDNLLKGEEATYSKLPSEDALRERLSNALGEEEADKVWSGQVQLVNTCGSGITAVILWIALTQLGIHSKVYDESWGAYSKRQDAVIEKDH
ncbi:hypothetical protein CI109_103020 [Kwoniella shandongensis]|uniref:Uncharacterized protein n=1 Tax=Kwoniella shandongensis TaxID=1734106 RepID=A0A5M6C897_9TREE|nr:uncharacterized protein CI109_000207 [Kwoniella shandongensis]KAA5531366.1 hypothetical protein CI109_000207 [Kwoniella shandongensis]